PAPDLVAHDLVHARGVALERRFLAVRGDLREEPPEDLVLERPRLERVEPDRGVALELLGRLEAEDPLEKVRVRAAGELLDRRTRDRPATRPRIERAARGRQPSVVAREPDVGALPLGAPRLFQPGKLVADDARRLAVLRSRARQPSEPPLRLVDRPVARREKPRRIAESPRERGIVRFFVSDRGAVEVEEKRRRKPLSRLEKIPAREAEGDLAAEPRHACAKSERVLFRAGAAKSETARVDPPVDLSAFGVEQDGVLQPGAGMTGGVESDDERMAATAVSAAAVVGDVKLTGARPVGGRGVAPHPVPATYGSGRGGGRSGPHRSPAGGRTRAARTDPGGSPPAATGVRSTLPAATIPWRASVS